MSLRSIRSCCRNRSHQTCCKSGPPASALIASDNVRGVQQPFLLFECYDATKSFTLGMCDVPCPTAPPLFHLVLLSNDQVDLLVRRVDIFEASSSGGRVPEGSMDLEDKSCGGGVDVARKGPGDLHSRQKKRRKLARSEDSPRLSPDTTDTQPVWEERTPARPVLFQARTAAAAMHYWRDIGY